MPGGRIAGAGLAAGGAPASGGRGGAAGLLRGGIGIEGTAVRTPASGGRIGCAELADCSGGAIGDPPPSAAGAGAGSSSAAARGVSFGFAASTGTGRGSAFSLASSTMGFGAAFFTTGCSGSILLPRLFRTNSAKSSSNELECVFFSSTPSSGNRSIMTLGFTSSSLASSLMRILLISPVSFGNLRRLAALSHPYAH